MCCSTALRAKPLRWGPVTATRDRHSDQDATPAGVPPEQRPLFGSSRGLPWWGSLLLALGLTVIGAVAEIEFSGSVGRVFEAACFVGCVAAVCLARRNSLFGPMVQPPLIMGISGPVVMLLLGDHTGSNIKSKLFAIATPLINSFPAMAVATVVTIAIGIARIVWARRHEQPPERGGQRRKEASEARTRRTAPPSGREESGTQAKRPGRPEQRSGTGKQAAGSGAREKRRDAGGTDHDRTGRRKQPSERAAEQKSERGAERTQRARGSGATGGQPRGKPGQQRDEQRSGGQRRGNSPERDRRGDQPGQPRRNPPQRGAKSPDERREPGKGTEQRGGSTGRNAQPRPSGRPRPDQPRSEQPRADKPRSGRPSSGKPRPDKPSSDKPRTEQQRKPRRGPRD